MHGSQSTDARRLMLPGRSSDEPAVGWRDIQSRSSSLISPSSIRIITYGFARVLATSLTIS